MTPNEKQLYLPWISSMEEELKRYSGEKRYGYLLGLRKSVTAFDSLFNLNTRRRLMRLQEFVDFSNFVDDGIKKFEINVT